MYSYITMMQPKFVPFRVLAAMVVYQVNPNPIPPPELYTTGTMW